MIGRFSTLMALAIAIGPPIATQGPAIRWEVDPSGTTSGVSVVGLSAEARKALADPSWTPDRKLALFSVAIRGEGLAGPDRPGMLGSVRVEGDVVRFTPRYPFDRGQAYSATFRSTRLPIPSGPDLTSTHLVPKPPRDRPIVTRVTPSTDHVPENLLKFYLHFNQPMSRGEVDDRVRLLKADGRSVDLPFLRIAEELWDSTGTRLTLLIDPGRIKRGLRPREESGPVLEAGQAYTLVIDPGWPDAEGDPLARGFRKTFRARAADEVQPDPKTWTIDRPAPRTRKPLVVRFPEPLDAALIVSGLALVDARGRPVEGRGEAVDEETAWSFTPSADWIEGDYQLDVDADLEDLAGNSILRPFEVDLQRDTPARPESKRVRIPVAIRPGRPSGRP